MKQVIGFTAGALSDALEVVTMSNHNGAMRSPQSRVISPMLLYNRFADGLAFANAVRAWARTS